MPETHNGRYKETTMRIPWLICFITTLSFSCVRHYVDYAVNESGGPPTYDSHSAIGSWNRSESFPSASAYLRNSDHSDFCKITAGNHLIVYASQGYILPLTANLMQYWALVACLPGDLAVGTTIPLKWANDASDQRLQPGEVAVRAKQGLSREGDPHSGKPAGRITLLSRSARTLRLRLELAIELNPYSPTDQFTERGLIKRELTATCQSETAKPILLAYPTGAAEEVKIPNLGTHWQTED